MTITINGTTGIAGVDGSASTPAVQGADTNTGIAFPASDTVTVATGGTERMRVDSSGHTLIGLTSSVGGTNGAALQVRGLTDSTDFSIALMDNDTTVAGRLHLESTGSNSIALQADPDNLGSNTYLGFGVDGSERARITSNGEFLVGTTSAVGGATRASFYNTGSGSAVVGIQNARNVSGDVVNSWLIGSNANNTSSYFVQAGVSGVANVFYIFGNGNVQNTNNSYGSISDVKLKENIVDATPKLADLMQIRVRNYNLKTNPDQKQIGVIAQELENIFPSLIDESPDKDSEGNELGTTTKAVKYSVFVPMLIKAIQELKAELDSAKTRLAALEAK